MATLSTIRQTVRDMLNEEYAGFFTDAKLNRTINRKYKSFAELLARRTNFYLKKYTLTTTSGTYLYTISGSTLMPIKDMVRVFDSYGYLLYKMDIKYSDTVTTAANASGFDVVGNQIAIYPTPTVTGTTYYVWYHEVPAELSGDSSTLSIPNGDVSESYLIDMVLMDCQYQSGDMDMYALTRQKLKDDGNKLWAMFDTTADVDVYEGDGRLEAPVVV